MNGTEELITDNAIDLVWGNANFGEDTPRREIIANGLLKYATGYKTGKTIREILEELGLVRTKWKGVTEVNVYLTQLGKEYLFLYYSNGLSV